MMGKRIIFICKTCGWIKSGCEFKGPSATFLPDRCPHNGNRVHWTVKILKKKTKKKTNDT